MEDRENPGRLFEGPYNKLISQDEIDADEDPLYSNQEKQQVSMSTLRPESTLNHQKLLAGSLAVLAVILLAVNIGLGVYYNQLTSGNHLIMDVGAEVAKLQATYAAAVQSRDEVKEQLAREISEHKITKWELEHQTRRFKDYERQINKIQTDTANIKSHIPMIKEGCTHCLPGWTFMSSLCYFIPLSENLPRKPWLEARHYCRHQGSDLAVFKSREKHLAVAQLLNSYQGWGPITQSGFWIGLRDIEEEGTWKWLDGTRLAEGYWNDGEPNDSGHNEDCAAVYPRNNPFKAWNDAPCTYYLKWICEMTPRAED